MSAVDVGMGRWVVATCGTCGTIFLHSLNCFKICFWIKSYYPDALFLDDIFFFSMLLPKCSLALRLHQKWLRDSLLKFWVCIRNLQKVHVKCVPKEYFVWISGIFFFCTKTTLSFNSGFPQTLEVPLYLFRCYWKITSKLSFSSHRKSCIFRIPVLWVLMVLLSHFFFHLLQTYWMSTPRKMSYIF